MTWTLSRLLVWPVFKLGLNFLVLLNFTFLHSFLISREQLFGIMLALQFVEFMLRELTWNEIVLIINNSD